MGRQQQGPAISAAVCAPNPNPNSSLPSTNSVLQCSSSLIFLPILPFNFTSEPTTSHLSFFKFPSSFLFPAGTKKRALPLPLLLYLYAKLKFPIDKMKG
jgi:hypothetical protein